MIVTKKRIKTETPYSAAQMFDLVADVDRYPEFLPWCVALRVVERSVDDNGCGTITADMVVAYKMFRERFRSKVLLDQPAGQIDVEYISGPFRSLQNIWRFVDLPDSSPAAGSVIDFEIAFEFRNFLLQATAQAVFDKVFSRMSGAFVERANDVYSGDQN